MANGTIKKNLQVKTTTYTGTTSGTGLLIPTLFPVNSMAILGVDAGTNQSYIVIPFIGNNTYWYFKILNNGNMGVIANTSLTLKIWYLEY